MTKSKTNPKADFYFDKEKKWKAEITMLRNIILDCGLKEELKWGSPCYTVDEDANVVLIHVFKEYCAVLFFKGAIMKDPDGILIQQTKNVQSARQIRFTNAKEVAGAKNILKSYIREAIAIERAGLKVTLRKPTEFAVAEEFQNRLDDSPALKKAFHALTPGRQRGYLLYFSSAKQAKTRESRVDKYIPQILKGKGLED
jgi:uncharacterized protein YdeI (YjbR/CyaY-like superfamily)